MNKDKIIIRLGEEKDTEIICEFINRMLDRNSKKFYIFKDHDFMSEEYSPIYIRSSLYNYTEEFILLEENGEIQGLISFKLPSNLSKAFTLNHLFLDNEKINILKDLFLFAKNILLKESIITPSKIRVNISSEIENYNWFIDILKRIGFTSEVIRYDKLNPKIFINSLVIRIKELEGELEC